MYDKSDLKELVLEALQSLGGAGTVVEVCAQVWRTHKADLERSGDLFYTWQYDIRWAAYNLRKEGKLIDIERGKWGLPQ